MAGGGLKPSGSNAWSAEDLDRMLHATSPRGWIALLAILFLVAGVGAWSVLGEYSTYARANGLLLSRDGRLVDAVATGRGRLDAIVVGVGDEIGKDTVVALISNEELSEQYSGVLALVDERSEALEALREALAEEEAITRANHARRRERLDDLEANAREILEVAELNYNGSESLFAQGIISRIELLRSQREYNEADRVLIELNRERDNLEAIAVTQQNENAVRVREMQAQVLAAERQARELAIRLAAERVLAPSPGQVVEIKASPGSLVAPGQAVLSIRTGPSELDVALYVPPTVGSQIEAGMEALVSPDTVRREEFGSVRGVVESISSFPVSFEAMVAVLQNQNLALTFSESGPPYFGRISLLEDPSTASGFVWTSPRGSTQALSAGTLVSVEIKTRSQPPITLALPLLREILGI